MKLVEEEGVVKSRGVQSSKGFTIAASSKAFSILSAQLYQDKIKAIIRELSTNAVDAHTDAGTLDKKFVVTLPTPGNLNFKIRDYGTGMSPEKIESLYTTYFGSDKNDSNDFVGCLGLGSKSPFSYTNSFYVTSYYNGMVYIYIATSVKGLPEIQLHSSAPTDEPNGLAVGFAVEPKDIYEFQGKAQEVYKYFKYRPEIVQDVIRFSEVQSYIEGKGWKIVSGGQSMAVMGHIAYPINKSHFHRKQADSVVHPNAPHRYHGSGSNYNRYQTLLDLGIHINVDIGEVEMTPSREDLQYTETTVDALMKRLDVIQTEIQDEINKKFSGAKNLYEARRAYLKLKSNNDHNFQKMVDACGASYNGVKLGGSVEIVTGKYTSTAKPVVPGCTVVNLSPYGYSRTNRIQKTENVADIHIPREGDDTTRFIEQDIERGAYVGCRRLILDTPNNGVRSVYLVKFDNAAARKGFCDLIGFDESYLTKASALPKPVRATRGAVKEKVFLLDTSGLRHRNTADFWKGASIDMDDGGVYVDISNYKARIEAGREVHPSDLATAIAHMRNLGIKVPDVVGVKTAVLKKFAEYEDAEWTDLKTEMHKLLDEHIAKGKLGELVANTKSYGEFDMSEKYVNYAKGLKHVKQGTDFAIFLEKVDNANKVHRVNSQKVQSLLDVCQTLGYNVSSGAVAATNFNAERDALEAKYEFLKLDRVTWNNTNIEIVARLINKEN